jgi:hypothetical protein
MRDNIPKNSFLRVANGWQSIFSICFELKRGSWPYLQGEIVSPISFPWDSFGHKVSEWLSITIMASHGDLGCLWRSCLFVEINSLVASWLGPKGFHS